MKILYVTTISNTVNAFLIPHIELLIQQGHKVDVAFNIEQEVNPKLSKLGCIVHNINFLRSPINRKNYIAYKKLKKLIQIEKYDIVHTHTPVASALVRLVCRKMKNIKVIYTAHGFHFFKGAPLKNWLIFYPVEYWLSKYTDLLITINKEDFNRAKKSFKARKIEYIPGIGLDIKKFIQVNIDKYEKRKELCVEENSFVILSVGELNKNKNHETIIRALAKINDSNIIYLICGEGKSEKHLRHLSKQLGIENHVKFLGYRNDIAEICKAVDIFAFPSKREGLGMAALEAMATNLPIITSNVHGINDYSIDSVTGYKCNPTDVEGFVQYISKLKNNYVERQKFGLNSGQAVKTFSNINVKRRLSEIYQYYLNS